MPEFAKVRNNFADQFSGSEVTSVLNGFDIFADTHSLNVALSNW
jgi:hypothetical protein